MNEFGVHVLCEDRPALLVLKPAGLLTQAPPGIDSMELRIKNWLKVRDERPGNVYLGVPHRLDRPVSGAMVFALNSRATTRLSKQFENRTLRKIYWACVAGRVEPELGTWTDHLRKIPDKPWGEVVSADHPDGRTAVLDYRTLGTTPWGSWLEIELKTGRMHQIRIQASTRGHAVLGDTLYGSEHTFGTQYEDVRLQAIALHGRSLSLCHPMTKAPISVTAPLAAEWRPLELPIGEEDYLTA
jgi:23S rRNA pseudouridine1911/1915/1917 synthase